MSDWDDEHLAEAIRRLNEPPPDVVAAAHAIPTWARLDLELELLIENERTGAVRATPHATDNIQSSRFRGRTRSGDAIEIRIHIDTSKQLVSGIVAPAMPLQLTILGSDEFRIATNSDDDGFFELEVARSGLFRLIAGPPANVVSPTFIV